MVAACHHVNLAASAPPYSLFLDRHFPGFPRYALYPSVHVDVRQAHV